MEQVLERVHSLLWGPALLAALISLGLYFGGKTGWVQLHFFRILKQTLFYRPKNDTKEGISSRRAASAALAGTVGTGNIIGVSAALLTGGAGAVFWMWVSALLGMGIKYAEILLAVYFKKQSPNHTGGGPMYYMEQGLGCKPLAVWFSVAAIGAALTGGCFTQVNAVCSVLGEGNLWLTAIVGAGIALLAGLCIFGGIHRISKVTSVLVPVFSILFLGAGLVVIFCCLPQLPGVFALIFQQAFSLESVSGGLMGTGLALSLRLGMARGIFSNEAGVGSSPMVYASGKESDPVRQGLWGVLEVFLDTIVICTVTALVILLTVGISPAQTPMEQVNLAFSSVLGEWARPVLGVSIFLFAFAALLSWCFYGEQGIRYLGKSKTSVTVYRCLFVLFCFLGALYPSQSVWLLGDCCNGMMLLPNVIALLLLRKQVICVTKESSLYQILRGKGSPQKSLGQNYQKTKKCP